MKKFNYKKIYIENQKKVLEINLLPEKYCDFDCIFCPLERAKNDFTSKLFNNYEEAIEDLNNIISNNSIDLLFINSSGESFINKNLKNIIEMAKSKNIKVRLLSNGYLLDKKENKLIANICDEIIGEIKTTEEDIFQKIQRPLKGYTLKKYIQNMTEFNKQYNGKFILEVTIIKGCSDFEHSIKKFKEFIKTINPDELIITTINYEPFSKKLGVSNKFLEHIKKNLSI